ncbi:UvrD-helicase domain-containing protein [Streptomyces sp. DSM 44917]|uniref:DNA 3'-5' helicase n=1 Tax=Streptomyces boetiae TaxID=3075541 RepID=A0ABU2LFP3_9ACTN|nr:UvrD-helicase domain-containing protein [Streptomyces sp. DSM 44917]MDT0310412.1 UvrD-helicase domain-containing protein [Streptomyces sp. DSM 44917]
MLFHADLHIHSKYSRACSQDCDLEHLTWWARRKGITLVGTGDFTHPAWFRHLKDTLLPAEPGLFRLREELDADIARRLPPALAARPVRFMLSVEISTIYKRADRTRKVHHLVYMPDFASAEEFNRRLGRIGNIASDGRPILGLDSRDLLEIALECGEGAYLVPAHVWTPWFAVLGSKSGFDAIEDCYADLAHHVFALETGLSSDPEMNWRISGLDRYRLVSNSDAHSPPMLGRETTLFDTELDYFAVRRALETGQGHAGSVEFFPEEGKYHVDGHRKCGVRMDPWETREHGGICPVCGKPLTVGVLSRVEELADRAEPVRPEGAAGFRSLVPLPEVVGEILGVGPKSKRVQGQIDRLTASLGPELSILQEVPAEDVGAQLPLLGEAVARLRRGEVIREAGFDGEYGTIRLFEPGELGRLGAVSVPALFDVAAPGPTAAEPPAAEPGPGVNALGDAAGEATAVRRAGVPAPDGERPGPQGGFVGGLDPEQEAAAAFREGPLLIVAGPGTGKTRTLTHRIARLVTEHGVAPEHCLAITFTRRAAEEMRERLAALIPRQAGALTVATFHSLGLSILREQHERAGLVPDFGIAEELEGHRPDLVDLDDLIGLPLRLLDEDPELVALYRERYRWISVDEYQDVDERQYRLLRHLAPPDGNLTAIGDPDQSIYRFRGAEVGFFLRFAEDFPGARTVRLSRNYRSSAPVLAAAVQAVAPSTLVPGRELLPCGDHGRAPVGLHRAPGEQAEATFVARTVEELLGGASFHAKDSGWVAGEGSEAGLGFSDFAVLYRTDRQARAVAEALTRAGLPFQKRSHDRLRDRPGVAEAVAQLAGLEGTLTQRLRAVAEAAGEAPEAAAAVEVLLPLAERCGGELGRFLDELALGVEVDTWDPRADRISLLTLHAAKGLEFPVVFVVGCEDGLLPMRWPGAEPDPEGEAEERRLLFVGMTRAQRHLFLSHAAERARHGGAPRPARRSPFLDPVRDLAPVGAAIPRQRRAEVQLRLL